MINLGSKMSSLLLATIVLAKLGSAQGLPWLDDPPVQNRSYTEPSAGPNAASAKYGAAGRNPDQSFHGDHSRRDPGAHGPEEPAAHHIGNSGLRTLP